MGKENEMEKGVKKIVYGFQSVGTSRTLRQHQAWLDFGCNGLWYNKGKA
jgi:hypothetical protein